MARGKIPLSRVLFDLNVVLDAALQRAPHDEPAALLWTLAEERRIKGFVAAHGVTTLFFLTKRHGGVQFASLVTERVLRVFDVAAADAGILRAAAGRAWPDFEDAVCAESALAAGCDLIVTRDASGFPSPPLPVLDPWEALSLLWAES